MEDNKIDKEEFNNAINYFQSIFNNNNITNSYSPHPMGGNIYWN